MNPARTPALSPGELAAWVSATCRQQGVPVTISNPATLATVATLLGRPASAPSVAAARRSRETVSAAS